MLPWMKMCISFLSVWLTAFGVIGAGVLLLQGCAANSTSRASQDQQPNYTFVYLLSGPKSGTRPPEERKAIFTGHMSNMKRLADDGTLLIAGPFSNPSNSAWRGLFVFSTPDAEQAMTIGQSDPGVQAGEFALECHPMSGPAWIADAVRNDTRWKESIKSEPVAPGEPPRELRSYVIVTAENAERAERALRRSDWKDKIVWHGRFTDTGQGVFVLDALKPDDVRPTFEKLDVGPCSVDGWYSTASLPTLRPAGT